VSSVTSFGFSARRTAPLRAAAGAALALGVTLAWTLMLGATEAHAGEYASIGELGVKFYSGNVTPNLTGSYGFFLDLRAERKKGIFRPDMAAELEYATGTARFDDSDKPTFSMMGGSFLGGLNIFMFSESQLLPFFGANALLGWNVLKLTGQKAGVEANTEGLAYGYELNAGCDIRKSAGADEAFRVRTGYWWSTSTLGGASGFQLSGWRISVGYVF
jgi:hypothetical protein